VRGGGSHELQFVSGDMFEFKNLAFFGVPVGFQDRDMTVRAHCNVRTFSIGVVHLRQMAVGSVPMRQAWLLVIIASLARVVELYNYQAPSAQRADVGVEVMRAAYGYVAP